jgi:hypothetical protein
MNFFLSSFFGLIFDGLADAAHSSKLPRWLRIILAILVSLVFLIAIAALTLFVFLPAELSLLRRLLGAIIDIVIILYFAHWLRRMWKA